jgi:predicted nucleic acid-binding protein
MDRLVDQAEAGQASLLISAINLSEVFYNLRKASSQESALQMIAKISGFAAVVEVSEATAIRAAELKYRHKLGYGDSFAALLAIERKATLVTADPDFDKLGKSLKLLRLQRFRGAE